MATKRLSAYNIDINLKELLTAMLADIQNAGVAAAVATDLTALQATVAALVVDVTALRGTVATGFSGLSAHTHTGSATAHAAVAAPAAVTSTAPDAITAVPVAAAQVIA